MPKITRPTTHSAYVPEWLSHEVNQALAAITGEHVAKKETTVLRLAQAIASNQSQASVWEQAGTCTKSIWHGRGGKPGWKDDPAIAHALQLAEVRARWWARVREGRALQDAQDELIDLAPDAARQLASVVRRGQMVFERADTIVIKQASVAEVIRASVDVLDRAGVETAAKGSSEVSGKDGAPLTIKLQWGDNGIVADDPDA